MTHKRTDGPKPLPRLQHIEPGQFFTLVRPKKTHKLLSKGDLYGYIEHGRIGLSTELDPESMVFGDGRGWRLRPNLERKTK